MRYLYWIVAVLAAGLAAAWAWYACSYYLFLVHKLSLGTCVVAFGPLVGVLGVIAVRRRLRSGPLLASCTVVLLGFAFVVFGMGRDQQLLVNGKGVTDGMSSSEVQADLGKPSWRGPCGADTVVRPHGPDCKSELVYNSSFAPMNPSYLIIQLNERDQVIWVDWIISP